MNVMAIETLNSSANFWMQQLVTESFLIFSTKFSSRLKKKMGVVQKNLNRLMKSGHQSND